MINANYYYSYRFYISNSLKSFEIKLFYIFLAIYIFSDQFCPISL